MNDTTPNTSWNLKRLANFCKFTLRRTATDAWYIGQALSIARTKQKDKRNWLRWLGQEVGMSRSAAYRYMDIARKFSLKDVQDRGLTEILNLLAPPRKPAMPGPTALVSERPKEEPKGDVPLKVHNPGRTPESSSPGLRERDLWKHSGGEQIPDWAVRDPNARDSYRSSIAAFDRLEECLSGVIERSYEQEWDGGQRSTFQLRVQRMRFLLARAERLGRVKKKSA